MANQVLAGFPDFKVHLQDLVQDHLGMGDEPLLLAIYYAPDREPQDVFLFEVIDGFGSDTISPDREVFEVTYASGFSFPLQEGQKLHLVLTNPEELRVAVQENWKQIVELRQAIRERRSLDLHIDRNHSRLRELLND